MKTKTRLLILLFSFFLANGAYGYDIQNINPVDTKKIEFSIMPEVDFPEGEVTGDIKVLKDLEINYASKDFNDSNKIKINLKNDLLPNRSYNLLSVFGVDGNMDFSLGEELSLVDIQNPENILGIQGISRILVMDPRNIEVYFNDPIDATEFEFKIFRESLVQNIVNSGTGTLTINLSDDLDKSSNYLMMLISLKDSMGIDLTFLEEIYDFVTPDDLGVKKEEPKAEEEIVEEANTGSTVEENVNSEEDPIMPESIEEKTMSGELHDVALNAAITPKSGPETWVLIFLTIIINAFLFIRKKIIK